MGPRKIKKELKKIWKDIPPAHSEKTKLIAWNKLQLKLFSANDKKT